MNGIAGKTDLSISAHSCWHTVKYIKMSSSEVINVKDAIFIFKTNESWMNRFFSNLTHARRVISYNLININGSYYVCFEFIQKLQSETISEKHYIKILWLRVLQKKITAYFTNLLLSVDQSILFLPHAHTRCEKVL